MSLDVYLTPEQPPMPSRGSGMFVRERGETKEISRAEWDLNFPGREPVILQEEFEDEEYVFTANITHNLNTMAEKAGIYQKLWRQEEVGIETAKQLIGPLRDTLRTLKKTSDYFKQFNPKNGWGDYDGLVSFVARYLRTCEENPEAKVSVSR